MKRSLLTALAMASMGLATQVSAAPFAFLCNADLNTVKVVDMASDATRASTAGQIVATIPISGAPVAAVSDRDGVKTYVVRRDSNQVTVVDATNYSVIGTINTGRAPLAAVISPDGTRLYVANSADNTVSVIDTASYTLLNTIPVGTQPSYLRLSTDGKQLYVANRGSNNVSVIDTSAKSVSGTFTMPGSPISIANSGDDYSVFFVADTRHVTQVDGRSSPATVTSVNLPFDLLAMGTSASAFALQGTYSLANIDLYLAGADDNIYTLTPSQMDKGTRAIQSNSRAMALEAFGDNNNVALANPASTDLQILSSASLGMRKIAVGMGSNSTGDFINHPAFHIKEAHYITPEGDTKDEFIAITVVRTGNPNSKASVHYQTASGTAFTNVDFEETKGLLEFDVGQQSKDINIRILGEKSIERDEDFTLSLNSPSDGHALGTQTQTTITLLNDDNDAKGCTVGKAGPLDPMLPVLAGLAAFGLWRRKKQSN